jgi:hypothetical protein
MIQANIPDEWKVKMDFEDKHFSRTVRVLNPTVYRAGDTYCCLLGPDQVTGIFGCGNDPIDAVQDWEVNVHQRIGAPKQDDELAQYVIDSLSISRKDVW